MAFAQQKGGVTTPLLLNLLVIYGGRLVSLQKIQKGYKQVAKMQIRIIYKLLFSYEFNVYVYIYILISYTDLSAIHKSTLQLYKCCPLDFFHLTHVPQENRTPGYQECRHSYFRERTLGEIISSRNIWVPQILCFRIRIFGLEPIFFLARGKHVFLYKEMCFFCPSVCGDIIRKKFCFKFQRSW